MKIVVGSLNPVKIKAVEDAFKKVWKTKKIDVVGIEIASGVNEQPMSDTECIKGAIYRAKKVMKLSKADYCVGIEAGLQKIGTKWFDSGWVVIINKKGEMGTGSSARVEVSTKTMKLIRKQGGLGYTAESKFAKKFGKQKSGYFGLMTNEIITRRSGYADGIIFALSRFIHPEMF